MTLRRDGYAYTGDTISAEGRQPIKLSADAPRIVIGIPIRASMNEITVDRQYVSTARTIAPEFMFSLLKSIPPINSSVIYRVEKGKLGGPARDSIIQCALEKRAKYIIFLDDDVLFPDFTMSRLCQRMDTNPDIGILSGVYCTNKMGFSEPLIYKNYGEGPFWDFELNELYDIYACGAGCMIVRVEAIRQMNPPWFFEDVRNIMGKHSAVIGHDVMVCRRVWEETKYRVCVDTGILCGHLDVHRGIIHILPKDSPPYRLSGHKRYFDTEIVNGTMCWSEHEPAGGLKGVSPFFEPPTGLQPQEYSKKLLILTVGGTLDYIEPAVKSVMDKSWNVMIINDGMDTDKLLKLCETTGAGLVNKDKAMGLTDSWNRAYREFKEGGYDVCCIANDDVLFAPSALKSMEKELRANGFILVGPVSNMPGHQPLQHVNRYLNKEMEAINTVDIEAELSRWAGSPEILSYLNGFCFMFDRRITKYELTPDTLFDPSNINIGNEDELCNRLRQRGGKVGFSPMAYVWHKKGVSTKQSDRNLLWNAKGE